MKSRKEILIDSLHGSSHAFDGLVEKVKAVSIYDENGYVDIELFTTAIEWIASTQSTVNNVFNALGALLGCTESEEPKRRKKDDGGSKWSSEDILRHCTLVNNVIKLPNVQFNKKSYNEAKKWIEEAGGSWHGGKVQGFVFPFDATRVFSILHEGKRCNLSQDFQFFETPASLADWIVSLAGGIGPEDTVLEPSAGRGAIVKAVLRDCPAATVDCCEMMPENIEILSKLSGVNIIGSDFIELDIDRKYSKIIANPPFSKNQDIRHVKKMFRHLTESGTMAAITSRHWQFAEEGECATFRHWLQEVNAEIHEIDAGEFKESGTTIPTLAIVIRKNSDKQ